MTSVLFATGTFLHYLLGILLFVVALFLILLVLVQRGRGGGLTGALGGMGGQSAFGTKAGDMFTRVTMATAAIWILLCMLSIWMLGSRDEWGASRARPGSGAPGGMTFPDRDSPDREVPDAPDAPLPDASGMDADAGAAADSLEPAEVPADAPATDVPEAPQPQDAAESED